MLVPVRDDSSGRSILLTIDVEDWHQLALRSTGDPGWARHRSCAFERQIETVLSVLGELGATATFFVLGATAERHPDAVATIAAHGHELGSHGYAHDRVFDQGENEFRRDLQRSVELIEGLSGRRPLGYRAPAFSINRGTPWAYEVLADMGFDYDSSQYDSPRVPRRLGGVPAAPYRLRLASGRALWELPVAVWRVRGRAVPVGGGSYWRLLPAAVLRAALREAAETASHPVLYFHPYEWDPRPLRPPRPPSRAPRDRLMALGWRMWFNPGRSQVLARVRRIAKDYRFTSYEEARGEIVERHGARSRALSADGVLV